MKRSKLRQFIIFIILTAVDIGLFIALIVIFRWTLIDLAGYDIADYEDPFGLMDSPRVYRFGAGCWEYFFVVLKAAVLLFIEKKAYKKLQGSKILLMTAIVIHVILLILCTIYVYKYLEGYNIFWLLRYLITGAEAPF